MIFLKFVRAISPAFAVAFGVLGVLAHGGATGIVAERMAGMMMLGEQTKLINDHFNGTAPVETEALIEAARIIEAHAGQAITEQFPEGSLDAPSEARPEIWSDWESFSAFSLRLEELAAELEAALTAPATPEVIPESAPVDEWEAMDVEVLLGLKTRAEAERERIAALGEPEPQMRAPELIFADISRNCGGCHERFRQ